MKPRQLSELSTAADRALVAGICRVRAALPTLAAVTVALASSVVLTLGGCASSAGIAPVAQIITPDAAGLDAAAASSGPPSAWWLSYADPALTALIERSLAGNPALKVVLARLARADAAMAGADADAGPQINGQLDATRQRYSGNSIYPPPLGGSIKTMGTAQLGASWEFDFFGRHRAALEAAVGAQRAAQADLQAASVLLATRVARTYIQLGALQEQREVAQRALQQRSQTLALVKQRVQGGLDTVIEQRQGEAALPETRQQIEQLDEQISLARHALAALTAQAPNALDTLTVPLRAVQVEALPAALPADLLGRRADISAARWRIEAASGDMRNAKAQFYPNINLTAFVGLQSIGLGRLIDAGSEQYGAGPAIHLPIFDSGRLRAQLRAKTAELDAAIESYNGAVIDAVHEAADQISSLQSVARQQAEQAQAQLAAESAFDLATQRYRAGLGTYLTVLSAEASVLNQRRQSVDLKARALDTQVALIRALGGGYTADTPSRGGYTADTPSRGGYTADAPSRGGYTADAPSLSRYTADASIQVSRRITEKP